jgi:hypothetical protein
MTRQRLEEIGNYLMYLGGVDMETVLGLKESPLQRQEVAMELHEVAMELYTELDKRRLMKASAGVNSNAGGRTPGTGSGTTSASLRATRT